MSAENDPGVQPQLEDERQMEAEILGYISKTPEMLSMLYDLDLLPEQLKRGSKDWRRMCVLAAWHESIAEKMSPYETGEANNLASEMDRISKQHSDRANDCALAYLVSKEIGDRIEQKRLEGKAAGYSSAADLLRTFIAKHGFK